LHRLFGSAGADWREDANCRKESAYSLRAPPMPRAAAPPDRVRHAPSPLLAGTRDTASDPSRRNPANRMTLLSSGIAP
jgi:hypothetical protein